MKLTITIDTDLVKVVPIEPTPQIHQAGQDSGKDCAFSYSSCYRAMLAAVPSNLPGVVEHSGEPIIQRRLRDEQGNVTEWRELSAKELGYINYDGWSTAVPTGLGATHEFRKLFTHPPAQPGTTQGKFDDWYTSISIEGDMRHNMQRAWSAALQPYTAALQARITELTAIAEKYHADAENYCRKFGELEAQLAAKQAKIDSLMLEYCPDEITSEQTAEWANHQRPAPIVAAQDDVAGDAKDAAPVFSPGVVRFMSASAVTDDERNFARQSELYKKGDMILVWANEGDIIYHNRFPVPSRTASAKESQ